MPALRSVKLYKHTQKEGSSPYLAEERELIRDVRIIPFGVY